MKEKKLLRKFLNEFEIYLGAVLFVAMTILLFIQVVTRYVFNHAFTWTEEISTIMFVWMIYLGVVGAVLRRKHLRIDAFVESRSFRTKKILLIVSNIIFAVFCLYLIFPIMSIVMNFAKRGAVTPLMKIPNAISYGMLPVCFALTLIRLIQEILKLAKEKKEDLGVSQPTIDMAALEKEAVALFEHNTEEEK